MICTTCGEETSDQQISCTHCGTVLNKECPRCAEIVKLKARACRFCGNEFTEDEVNNKPKVVAIPQIDKHPHGKKFSGSEFSPPIENQRIRISPIKKIFIIAFILIGVIASIIALVWFLPFVTNKLSGINGVINREGGVETCLNGDSTNFVAGVTFVNPSSTPVVANAGYGFKYIRYYASAGQELEVEYNTWVNWKDGLLSHTSGSASGNNSSTTYHVSDEFHYTAIKSGKGESNQLQLVVSENTAQLFVNGSPGKKLDLSEEGKFINPSKSGKICVGMFNFLPGSILESMNIENDHIESIQFNGFNVKFSSSPGAIVSNKPYLATESPLAATEAPISTEPPPASTEPPTSPIRLSPIAIESSEPSGGWIYHNVYFAFENQSTQWLPITIDSGQGVVETQEGFNYNGEPIRYSSMIPLLYGEPIVIPPDFRIVGSTDNYNGFENVLQFQFSSADTTTPLRVNFANYGMADLVNIPKASLNDVIMTRVAAGDYPFPTDQSRTSFSNMGESIEIPNQARITFLRAYPSEYGIFAGVTIDVEIQNLNPGYDTTVNAGCYMIDGMGFIRWNKEDTRFYAGPGQTNTAKLGFYLWNPSQAYYGNNDLDSEMRDVVLSNAKLICKGDFEAIFNIDS